MQENHIRLLRLIKSDFFLSLRIEVKIGISSSQPSLKHNTWCENTWMSGAYIYMYIYVQKIVNNLKPNKEALLSSWISPYSCKVLFWHSISNTPLQHTTWRHRGPISMLLISTRHHLRTIRYVCSFLSFWMHFATLELKTAANLNRGRQTYICLHIHTHIYTHNKNRTGKTQWHLIRNVKYEMTTSRGKTVSTYHSHSNC